MKRLPLLLAGARPALGLNFQNEATDSRIAYSGGANGTRVNASGTVASASAPRIDYNPVSLACNGLLIEEATTNLLLRSGNLRSTPDPWLVDANLASFFVATLNAFVAPDGTTTATRFVTGASTADGLFARQNVTVAAGAWVVCLYVYVPTQAGVTSWGLVCDFADTESGQTSAQTTFDRWCRVEVSATLAAQRASVDFNIRKNGSAPTNGDGFTFYAWGAQLSGGNTSYIPTTTAAVTRSADVASFAWTQAEGTYAVEFDLTSVSGTRPIFSLDDGTANNQIRLYASGTDLKLTVTTSGVTQADLTLGTVAANTTYKAAFSIRANEFLALMNGGTLQSDAAGTVPVVTTGRIGSDQAGNYQNGHSKRIRQWKPRKSLYQLVA